MAILKELLGYKIKNLRKLNNFTQERLAETIDVTPRQLVRLEAGKSYPSVETLWKLSKVFKININSLLNDVGEAGEENFTKSEINDLLSLASDEKLKLIKKIILAVL